MTERYCLYVAKRAGVMRADVHHVPWPLQAVDVRIGRNSLLDGLGVQAVHAPERAHYSPGVDVVAWGQEVVVRG